MTCALEGYINGNHILYDITKDKDYHVLTLWNVVGDRCEPKPEKCHCKTLLQELLELNPKVNRIDGYMKANPWLFGCRCYWEKLQELDSNSLRIVRMGNDWSLQKITTGKFAKICKKLNAGEMLKSTKYN